MLDNPSAMQCISALCCLDPQQTWMLPGSRRTTDHPSFTTILCLSELPTVSSPSSIILGPVFSSATSISHSSHWNQTWHSISVEMNSILKSNSWCGQPRHPLTPISSALPEATWHSATPHWSCNSLTHYCASVHSCAPKSFIKWKFSIWFPHTANALCDQSIAPQCGTFFQHAWGELSV